MDGTTRELGVEDVVGTLEKVGNGGGRSDGDVDHTSCQWSTFFLRHAFGRAHKLRLFGWRQRQAIDDKFAIILDSHLSHLRTDMR